LLWGWVFGGGFVPPAGVFYPFAVLALPLVVFFSFFF
jgi:hypothetical protein